VNNSTLQRFFIVHFLLPFVISILFYFHLSLLHKIGSSNLLNSGGVPDSEKINFYPYFLSKDIFALSLVLAFFFFIVGYYPNSLMHPDNYIPANPLVTPNHIVPE
jgi:ubiquinol-cytochrome c reductase cytochrome b subunit